MFPLHVSFSSVMSVLCIIVLCTDSGRVFNGPLSRQWTVGKTELTSTLESPHMSRSVTGTPTPRFVSSHRPSVTPSEKMSPLQPLRGR